MKRVYVLMLMILFFYSGNLFSQNVKYGIGGGFTFLLGSDRFTNEIDTLGTSYGFKSNFHFGAKLKAGITGTPLRLTGLINYTSLNGSKDNVIVTNPLGQTVAVDLESSGHIFTFSAGAEYLFIPEPISPYALLNIQLNSISDFSFTRKSNEGEIKTSSKGGTRFGLGLGGGIDFAILPQFDIDATATLNLYNLIGKERGEDSITGLNLTLNILYHVR